jgi:hypothetical protein
MTNTIDDLRTVSVREAAATTGFDRVENFLHHFEAAGFKHIRISERKRPVLLRELAAFINQRRKMDQRMSQTESTTGDIGGSDPSVVDAASTP